MGGRQSQLEISGVQISYYFICKTKLWLFSHNTRMEQNSDTVAMGKLIHQDTYKRARKEVKIGSINIDFVKKGDGLILHEVKKSKKMEESHRYQLLYYLYYLNHLGIKATGMIDYPLLRRNEAVTLDEAAEGKIEGILDDIHRIIALPAPPKPEKKTICRKCSYFEFCWVS